MLAQLSPLAAAVYALVALWLLITLVAQFRWIVPFTRWLDGIHLIPRWTFFAPNPGIRDHHLVLRERLADGQLGAWRSVPVYPPRPPLAWLWHPRKRASKVLSDAIQALGFLMRHGLEPDAVSCTLPYLVLVRYAAAVLPRTPGAMQFQIAIIDTAGHADRRLECSFLSPFHSR
jgi:hypothetical protein